jgi:hypothetical protein
LKHCDQDWKSAVMLSLYAGGLRLGTVRILRQCFVHLDRFAPFVTPITITPISKDNATK